MNCFLSVLKKEVSDRFSPSEGQGGLLLLSVSGEAPNVGNLQVIGNRRRNMSTTTRRDDRREAAGDAVRAAPVRKVAHVAEWPRDLRRAFIAEFFWKIFWKIFWKVKKKQADPFLSDAWAVKQSDI